MHGSWRVTFISILLDVEMGGLNVSWQKVFKESNQIPRSEGGDVLALSAFVLSTLSTSWERRDVLKEMWQSGADVMVGKVRYEGHEYFLPQICRCSSTTRQLLVLSA